MGGWIAGFGGLRGGWGEVGLGKGGRVEGELMKSLLCSVCDLDFVDMYLCIWRTR